MARRDEPGGVLVTRFSALGDVAMAVPVIYAACRANPARKFVVLTRKLPSRLFLNHPENLTVVAVDTERYKGFLPIRRLFKELKVTYGIDTLVDLHDVIRTKMLRFAAHLDGVRTSHVDKMRSARRRLTKKGVKKRVCLPSMAERYADTFRRAGIGLGAVAPSIYQGRGEAPASEFSSATPPKQTGETWIAIAPFAAHMGKVYPPTLIKEIVAHYASLPSHKIFLFGSEDENEVLDDIAGKRGNVVSMARTKAGIAGELALMNHCDVMLAMDSANMHMATLAGLRTVSVWGATHPCAGFYPAGQKPDDAVQLEMDCRPCSIFGDKKCRRGDYCCLRGILPSQIISRIDAG